jgi:hypothetical protein
MSEQPQCGKPCPKHGLPCIVTRWPGKEQMRFLGAKDMDDPDHKHACSECVKEWLREKNRKA